MDLEDLLSALHLVAVAGLAAVLGAELLALALAVGTHALDLLNHSRSDLLHFDRHASSFTAETLLQGSLLTTITCPIKINRVFLGS